MSESLPVVFIVDDAPEICEILREELTENANVKIEIFTKPIDAIQRIENGIIPSLVVTDYRMPEMDGIELLTRIESLLPSIKGIIMSGETKTPKDRNPKWDVIEKTGLFSSKIKCEIKRLIE